MVQKSQYDMTVFIILNKEGVMIFIMYYCRLNQKFVRNMYPLPIIRENIHQLEGFQYANALDLNMEYYTICIFPASQDRTTIITELGEFIYNYLCMGILSSGDIF